MEPTRRIDFLEQLRKNWPIVLAIVGIVIGWNNLKNDNQANSTEINDVKVQIVALTLKNENNQAQMAEISGDIKAIKESLTFIKDKVK